MQRIKCGKICQADNNEGWWTVSELYPLTEKKLIDKNNYFSFYAYLERA